MNNPAAFWACCLLKQAGYLQVAETRVRDALPLRREPLPTANSETLREFEAALSAAMLVGFHFSRIEEVAESHHQGKTMDELASASLRTSALKGAGGKKSGEIRGQHLPEILEAARGLRAENPFASDDWIARTLSDCFDKLSAERMVKLVQMWKRQGNLPKKALKARQST